MNKLAMAGKARKRSIPQNHQAVKLSKGKGFSRTRLTFEHPDKHNRHPSENIDHAKNNLRDMTKELPSNSIKILVD